MANTTDTLDPEAQQDALNRRLALLGGGSGVLDAGAVGGGELQVPVPSGPGSDQLTADTGVVTAPTPAPSAAQDMADIRAGQNAMRTGDLLGAQRQNALEQRIGVRIGDLNAPGTPGLYAPAATGGAIGTPGATGQVIDALNRRLSQLNGGAVSSTSTPTNQAGVSATSPDVADRNIPQVPGQPTPTPPSPGAGMGPTSAPPPLVKDNTGAFQPNPNTGAGPNAAAPASPSAGAAPSAGITPNAGTPGAGTGPGAGSGNTGAGGGAGGAIDIGGFLGQLNDIQKAINGNTPSDATAVYAAGLKNILDMLNQQEQQIRADAANGKVIDPQTQQALDALTKNLGVQLQHTQEELNRRGLYSSGILADLENKLRTGNASDQANLLNDRLARMQSDLQKQLGTLNQNRFSAANNFYAKGAEAQTSADELTRKLRADLVGQRMQQIAADQAAQAQRAFQQRQQAAELEARRQNEEANRQNAITLENLRLSAARRAGGGSGGVNVPQINNPFGGATKTPNVSANATNNMIQVALGNLRSTPNGTNAPQILDDLHANAAALARNGVDVQAIEDAITQASRLGADYTRGNRTVGGPI